VASFFPAGLWQELTQNEKKGAADVFCLRVEVPSIGHFRNLRDETTKKKRFKEKRIAQK